MVKARTGCAEVDFRWEWRIVVVGILWILLVNDNVRAGEANQMDIDAKLRALNKPAVKSIHSSDGDIIDCIDIYKQPAFDHPALKNHKIQMRPNFADDKSRDISSSSSQSDNGNKMDSDSSLTVHQTWQKFGSCPDGTIPIRRVRKAELARATNIESFGRQQSSPIEISKEIVDSEKNKFIEINGIAQIPYGTLPANRSTAALYATSYPYTGARGYLNVWNPRVEGDDYTTSQIWLERGPMYDADSIESGWMVSPSLYGDNRTRLFIYWTSDSSRTTGCFNLFCPGFVQTSKEIALGAVLEPTSTKQGSQYLIFIEIRRDKFEPKWWLRVQDRWNVGYWPGAIFSRKLDQCASLVKWGGQVYSPGGVGLNRHKRPHTATAMGSGEFATNKTGIASYIFHIRVLMGRRIRWMYPNPVYILPHADEPNCYSVMNYYNQEVAEEILYFGGPGSYFNPRCNKLLEEYTAAIADHTREFA